MQRNLTTERIYPMGNYANIKFAHTLNDIPESIALNVEAMKLLEYTLLLDVEYSYKRYHRLMEVIAKSNPEEVLSFIEAEQQATFEQLIKTINQKTGE